MTEENQPPPDDDADGRTGKPYRFSNPKQQEIHERFRRLIGPGPAANFRDACRILDTTPPFETTSHVVAHLFREIESALRTVISPQPDPLVDSKLLGILANHNVPSDGPLAQELQEYASKKLKTGGHQASISAILQFLGIPEDDPLARAWLETAEDGNRYSLHRFAHRDNLNAPRPADADFRSVCERFQTIFEGILDRFEAHYLKVFAAIDELRQKPSPDSADADLLAKTLPNTLVAHEHFLESLDNPAWLPFLRKKKFFATPPPPVIDEEQRLITYASWPEARYLARIASHPPSHQLVAQILTKIPPTANVRVHYDLCQAALALPASLVLPWAQQEAAWIEEQEFIPLGILALELAKLIVKLAEASNSGEAYALLHAILLPRATAPPGQEENRLRSGQPPARIGDWDYQQVLKTVTPTLTETAPLDLIRLLLESLTATLGGNDTERERRAELSYIWREAIESEDDPGIYERAQGLVSAIRDSTTQALTKDPTVLQQILPLLDACPGALYQRLALHLLRQTGPDDLSLVSERLTNQRQLQDVGVRHEYAQLLHDKFALLSAGDQQAIIDLILTGPPIERFRTMPNPVTGQPHTEEEIMRYARAWTRDLLSFIGDVLPESAARQYAALVRDLGEPESPAFPFHRGRFSTFADMSPLTDEALREMPVEHLTQFLTSWEPTGEFHAPSRDGLAAQLTRLVTASPEAFTPLAPAFIGTHPEYVRGVVQGFRQAADHGDTFNWQPVLALCQWAVEQPDASPPTDRDLQADSTHWSWARQAVNDLLASGLKTGPAAIPFALRQPVWALLEVLATDPDPKNDALLTESGDRSHYDAAINSIRGRALELVIEYAVWTKKTLADAGEDAIGIDHMPEVKRLIEDHLDPGKDSSLAVRSIYGVHLHRLFWIDRQWATGLVPRIFPDRPGEQALDREAWTAFLVHGYHGASQSLFEVLCPRYERAVGELTGTSDQKVSHHSPAAQLGHNLINLYAAGIIDLGGLLPRFFANAWDHLRAEIIDWIGTSLRKPAEVVAPEVLQRFRGLWEYRITTVTTENTTSSATRELLAFGAWFASGQWPEDWAADQLLRAYDLTGQAPPDYWVLKHLVTTAATDPLRAIRILHEMIIKATDTLNFLGYTNEIREVITIVLRDGDAPAQRLAAETTSRLIAKGYRQLRDLIPPSANPESP